MVAESRLSIARRLLPFVHAGIALALLLHLYLPGWARLRKRDIAYQAYIEAEARAGRWPPVNAVRFEPDYFGPPKQITAMLPANLPSVVIAGFLVVPSTARDRLLENAPGRILPTTRALIFVVMFALIVALQWYLIERLTRPPRLSAFWRKTLCIAPIACIPIGLVLSDKWGDLFRIAPLWAFILVGTLLHCRRRNRRVAELECKSA